MNEWNETKWQSCPIRKTTKQGEDFVLNVVNLSARKNGEMWPEWNCTLSKHHNTFPKKGFSMPVRWTEIWMFDVFYSDLAICGKLSLIVQFCTLLSGQSTSMAKAHVTCDPSLQVSKRGLNSSLIKSVIHAGMLECTGRMLSSAHLNDFLAQCAHPSGASSFDYPLKLEHINGRTCFDCLRVCTFP